MTRAVSLNARTAADGFTSDEVEVVLIRIMHPDLDAPVLLSTDPTERLSDDPLAYGTRSTWMDADPATEPYLFVLASADIPGDLEDAPASSTIVLQNVDNDIATVLRGFTGRPVVDMAVVLAATPDVVEMEFHGMVLGGVEGNLDEVSLSVSRVVIEDETAPKDYFTKQRFPGLYR